MDRSSIHTSFLSINLLAFNYECCNLIDYATCYSFVDSGSAVKFHNFGTSNLNV